MAGFNFNFGPDKPASRAGSLAGRIAMCLFAAPFVVFGLFAISGGIKKGQDTGSMVFICLFGLVFAGIGFGLIYAAVTAGRRQRAADEKWRAQTDDGRKPWLARADWAAGRIKSSSNVQNVILGIMAAAFCGMGGVFTVVMLPEELRKGNHKALLVLIFPLAGIGLFAAFIRGLLARRRFGDCYFELASIPGSIGGTLEGLIQTGARIQLEHGLTLKISCIRRVVTGSGKNRRTHESILWQDEKLLNPRAGLLEPEPGRSGIPVYFKIPDGQPECFSQGNETILWRLEAGARMAGPDFSAAFDVPVFRVPGRIVAADEPDPTASLQMPVEELRRDEHSTIQVSDVANGREFHFPAARNLGPAIFVSLFAIGAGVGSVALVVNHVSLFAAVIVSLFAVIFGWIGINLLFKSSRVTINASGLTLHNRWSVFSRTRRFEASEVARFDTAVGMTSGTKAFHDIKLITHEFQQNRFEANDRRDGQAGLISRVKTIRIRDGHGVTLGSAVGSAMEAKWLVQEMTKALTRRSDNL